MKLLSDILPSEAESVTGDLNTEITSIAFNSQNIKKGGLFVALSGKNTDGSAFIFDAIKHGAAAVILESNRKNIEVPAVKVKSARKALSEVSAKFYDRVAKEVKLFGITGTKGKTTITYFLQAILCKAFGAAFRFGTIEYDLVTEKIKAVNTTPESLVLHELMNKALLNGINHGVIEVSSHALKNWRVENLKFTAAAFSNLSLEHTELHSSMEDYFAAKKRLFTDIAAKDKPCVICIDDEYGKRMAKECKQANLNIKTASALGEDADYKAFNIKTSAHESTFSAALQGTVIDCKIHIPGIFNVSNALIAGAMAHAAGIGADTVKEGLENVKHVPGRLEAVPNSRGINVVIDYAHSPAAIENVLKALRPLTKNKLFCVFGCGGDRSHEKRPVMGKITAEYSDTVVVTSDNPRREEPEAIIKEIMSGIPQSSADNTPKAEVFCEPDRKKAIYQALSMAKPGDTVLIAGKGHETGQIFADKTIHFDDREIAASFFNDV